MTKTTFLLISFFFIKLSMAQQQDQTFVTYKDTANGFSINIPSHWKFGISKAMPKLALMALSVPAASGENPSENFNVNVISTPGKNLDQTFATFTNALKRAANFQLVATGDTTLNGSEFKWAIETHTNQISGKEMLNYDFVTVNDEKTYILTLVTYSEAFESIKPLFNQIAGSFRVDR